MIKIEEFQILQVKEKVGMLTPDEWVIYSEVKTKTKHYYKVMLKATTEYKPIGVVSYSELQNAIQNGGVELKGIQKIKKKKHLDK